MCVPGPAVAGRPGDAWMQPVSAYRIRIQLLELYPVHAFSRCVVSCPRFQQAGVLYPEYSPVFRIQACFGALRAGYVDSSVYRIHS